MSIFSQLSGLFTLAVLISYVNYRFVKMHSTIAITLSAMLMSILLIASSHLGLQGIDEKIANRLDQLNFNELLMNGMLSFLLFAGALSIDLRALKRERWEIIILAFLGTIASTFIIATLVYYVFLFLNHPFAYVYCLLFGALISPTDPIVVLAIFKTAGMPKSLDARLAGESLFNDGVGVVLFVTIYSVAFDGHQATVGSVVGLFLQEAIGGILYGAVMGYLGYRLIKTMDDSRLEILMTLAIVTGGYAFAQAIGISGPLAMVVAGIIIGSSGRSLKSFEHLDHFWEVIDAALNAILFLLIGLEIILIPLSFFALMTGVIAIVITLIARVLSVGLPLSIMEYCRAYEPYSKRIMIWGGLRGGLAIALALAIPPGPERHVILPMTYAVVLFSIFVQGLSVHRLIASSKKKLIKK